MARLCCTGRTSCVEMYITLNLINVREKILLTELPPKFSVNCFLEL